MGQVRTKEQDLADLRKQNPRAMPAHLQIYVDALADYRLAQANIDEHGTIVFHPRTGSPIENPYLAIRNKAADRLLRLGLKAAGLW